MQIVVDALLSGIKAHNPDLNEAQLRTRRYGLEVFVNEFVKTLAYLLIFSLFSLTGYYLAALLIYCSIRVVSGGYHAGSFWKCMAISLICFAAPIFMGQYINPGLEWKIIILAASMLITAVLAPVNHKNTPKRNLAYKRKYKTISILMVAFWSGFALLAPGAWSSTAVFTIFAEAIMQLMGKFLNPT